MWKNWNDEKPPVGMKVVIVTDDGCSCSLAFVGEDGPMDAEDGEVIYDGFMDNAIWMKLPDDYPLSFMEVTPEDWR